MQIETVDWQGLVQYLSSSVGMGYYYFQKVKYPVKKKDEWERIDQKMIERFDLVDRYKRARRKQKGWANFLLARHENTLYVLMSEGETPPHIDLEGENFEDARKVPLVVKPGKSLSLHITCNGGKTNVHWPREFTRDRRALIEELAKAKNPLKPIKRELYLLGGVPCYSGIHKQREALVKFAIKELRKNQVKFDERKLVNYYKRRTTRKVFKTDTE